MIGRPKLNPKALIRPKNSTSRFSLSFSKTLPFPRTSYPQTAPHTTSPPSQHSSAKAASTRSSPVNFGLPENSNIRPQKPHHRHCYAWKKAKGMKNHRIWG
ncbi:hypothetical protein H5410_015525 [Solanum commersonii]|uniref:Uncharacterized protein n=1 Tax=Solanum commersonii TaxID=4109 RepID=A0A9J5ZTR5_SOLCO|nr:hypothetical protein H5410_015525 [Solanum commersonii]